MLDCWNGLDSARPFTPIGIASAIPWPAIAEWGRLHGLGDREIRVLAEVIRILDHERTERINSELEAKKR